VPNKPSRKRDSGQIPNTFFMEPPNCADLEEEEKSPVLFRERTPGVSLQAM
jgi:hypothetical protein